MKRYHACFLLSLSMALGLLSTADAASRLRITGNDIISEARVRKLLASSGVPATDPGWVEPVQEAYYREGHFLVRISVTLAADSAVVVNIEDGPAARVGTVRIAGISIFEVDEIRGQLGLIAGRPFRPAEFDRNVEKVLQRYDEAGRPYAQAWIDSAGFDEERNLMHLSVFFVEGNVRTIGKVSVEGLRKTRPEMVRRIAGIRGGERYSATLLRAAHLRLAASGIFDSVDYPTLRLSADGRSVDAVIKLVESERSHSFTAAVGYATREGENEDKELSGLVDLNLRNIGGSLKDFMVHWTSDGKERVSTSVGYRDLFFLGRNLSVGIDLEQIGQDTLYTWQSVGVNAEIPVGRIKNSLLSFTTSLHADRNVFSRGDLLRSFRLRASAGLSVERAAAVRRSFSRVAAEVTMARKNNINRDSSNNNNVLQYIAQVEAETTFPLLSNILGRVAGEYRGLESEEQRVPISEQFYIGGARTLRGYNENQFHGRRVATTRAELLVGPNRWENVYALVDGGYVQRESLDPEGEVTRDDKFLVGYGFGVRTRSRVGNIEFSFAIGEKLSLQQTKIHVILIQSF